MFDSQKRAYNLIILSSISKIRKTKSISAPFERMGSVANKDDEPITVAGCQGPATFQIPLMGVSNEDDDPVDVLEAAQQ